MDGLIAPSSLRRGSSRRWRPARGKPWQRRVQLSLVGQQKLAGHQLAKEGIWQNARRREEFVSQALHALYLLNKDRDYLVHEGKVLIIDTNTGRTMPDRSWKRGLNVIATCCNEAKRIDRQLYGRCARQGDPGSHQSILSLEDELLKINGDSKLCKFLLCLLPKGSLLQNKVNLYMARRTLMQSDRETGRTLAFSGNME